MTRTLDALGTLAACALIVAGCSTDPEAPGDATHPDAASAYVDAPAYEIPEGPDPTLPYATEVVSFTPGDGAGFGAGDLPNVVLGPPHGRGRLAGSTHVVSLGVGGAIVLSFGDRAIVDGDGPDLVVFENPFEAAGGALLFGEPAAVSVSADGETWHVFPCEAPGPEPNTWPGCAGWRPVQPFDPRALIPLDPAVCGGDPFDLADVGLREARFVRIVDQALDGAAPTAGFDLDAVGAVHLREIR